MDQGGCTMHLGIRGWDAGFFSRGPRGTRTEARGGGFGESSPFNGFSFSFPFIFLF